MPLNRPIPSRAEEAHWWELPCRECGEPLVPLRETDRLHLRPVYASLGFAGASTTFQLREGVVVRLERALATLPEHLGFVLLDGFRPLSVQKALWDWQWNEVRTANPHFTEADIYEQVRHFVAEPIPDPLRPTPHRTGGAVDLTLFDRTTGEDLPLGTAFDEAAPATVTDWFERHPQAPVTQNRRLLYHTLVDQDFANYVNEWWHFEFGTRRWAGAHGTENAVYGSAE